IKADPLPFIETFQPGLFDCSDVDENIPAAVVLFNESVAPLAIEKFHDTRLCHRENSSPHCSAAGPTHGGSAGHSQSGKASANRPESLRRPPQEAERHCQHGTTHQLQAGGEGPQDQWLAAHPGSPSQSRWNAGLPSTTRMPARTGKSVESSLSRVHGGLTTIIPVPLSRLGLARDATRISTRKALPSPNRRNRLTNRSGSVRPLIGYQSR